MKWEENPQLSDKLVALIAEDMHDEDRPLPSVTELIYCLTKAYNDRFQYLPPTTKGTIMMAVGVKLGDVFLPKLRREIGGEYEGIHSHIDFALDGHMGELKSTRYSPKKHPSEYSAGWHRQILGYMKVQSVTTMVFAVIHIIPAELKTWEVTATQEEIDTNWTWLQARKVQYMDFIQKQVRPTPFTFNEAWECRDCPYKLMCDAESAAISDRERFDATTTPDSG